MFKYNQGHQAWRGWELKPSPNYFGGGLATLGRGCDTHTPSPRQRPSLSGGLMLHEAPATLCNPFQVVCAWWWGLMQCKATPSHLLGNGEGLPWTARCSHCSWWAAPSSLCRVVGALHSARQAPPPFPPQAFPAPALSRKIGKPTPLSTVIQRSAVTHLLTPE